MSNLTNENAVLVKLLSERVVRLGKSSWRWAEKKPGNPSLKNSITSRMFRSDLVEEVDSEMKLTAMGRLIAEDISRTDKAKRETK